jgi:hypothetical protein
MGVKQVEAFNDSLLVVQQVASVYQCFDGSLSAYLDKYLETIALFNNFTVQHISRYENTVANDLAEQVSGFLSNQGNCMFWKNWMFWFPKLDGPVFGRCTVLKSILVNPVQQLLDAPISKTGGSRFF